MTDPNPITAGDPDPDAIDAADDQEPDEGADAEEPTGVAEPDPEAD